MTNPVNNTFPRLQDLAAQAVLDNSRQDTLECPDAQETPPPLGFSYNFEPPHAGLQLIKGVWDSFKVSFGSNSVMQNAEKSLITECCQKFDLTYCCLSPEDKEILLIQNVRMLFQRLSQELNVPVVTLETCSTLQKQWEEEALFILWNQGICPQLEEYAPTLSTIAEIRAWMADPNNAEILSYITVLNLISRGMKAIPPEIQHLPLLEKLWLQGNKIKCIPDFIGSLTALKELNLYSNEISCIPESIRFCKNLKMLCVNKNALTTIPKAIRYLTELESLALLDNKISHIPYSILLKLKKLNFLHLSGNPLFPYFSCDDTALKTKVRADGLAKVLLKKAKALNDYQCQGNFSSFVKYMQYAYSINRYNLIKQAYESQLNDKEKDFIYEGISLHLFGPFRRYCTLEIKKIDQLNDMDIFFSALISQTAFCYSSLSTEQRGYVLKKLAEVGETEDSAHILLLLDIMDELGVISGRH